MSVLRVHWPSEASTYRQQLQPLLVEQPEGFDPIDPAVAIGNSGSTDICVWRAGLHMC